MDTLSGRGWARSPAGGKGIPLPGLHLGQGLFQVGQDVLDVLDAHRQADEVGGDAGGGQLLFRELPVGGGGGVEHAGLGVGHAMEASFSPAMKVSAAWRPPLTPKVTTPQVPLGMYFWARAWYLSPSRPG